MPRSSRWPSSAAGRRVRRRPRRAAGRGRSAQFLRLTGFHRGEDGLSYTLPSHPECVARILLRSSAEVDTYKNAGDVIVTNPDRSAGVRVENGSPATCKALYTQALARVK